MNERLSNPEHWQVPTTEAGRRAAQRAAATAAAVVAGPPVVRSAVEGMPLDAQRRFLKLRKDVEAQQAAERCAAESRERAKQR